MFRFDFHSITVSTAGIHSVAGLNCKYWAHFEILWHNYCHHLQCSFVGVNAGLLLCVWTSICQTVGDKLCAFENNSSPGYLSF